MRLTPSLVAWCDRAARENNKIRSVFIEETILKHYQLVQRVGSEKAFEELPNSQYHLKWNERKEQCKLTMLPSTIEIVEKMSVTFSRGDCVEFILRQKAKELESSCDP